MLKPIKQELINRIFEAVETFTREEGFPATLAFGFDVEDYDGEWRDCCTSLMRQVIAPLLQRYEISNIAFYDDLSFEFTIEEERVTFI